jgi:CarD family transcriptional regulator
MAVKLFGVNDRVVYPGHGVARINRIVEKMVGRETIHFFELKFLNKEMTVLVPTTNLESAGIRPLSSVSHVANVFHIISRPVKDSFEYDLMVSNWNKRNKDYQSKIRKGDLVELSEIYRDLRHIARQKELSFGEKNLLHKAEMLLAEEIAVVEQVGEEKALLRLRTSINMVAKEA